MWVSQGFPSQYHRHDRSILSPTGGRGGTSHPEGGPRPTELLVTVQPDPDRPTGACNTTLIIAKRHTQPEMGSAEMGLPPLARHLMPLTWSGYRERSCGVILIARLDLLGAVVALLIYVLSITVFSARMIFGCRGGIGSESHSCSWPSRSASWSTKHRASTGPSSTKSTWG